MESNGTGTEVGSQLFNNDYDLYIGSNYGHGAPLTGIIREIMVFKSQF